MVVLELLIEHHAVGRDDHAVEHAGVVRIVQRRQAMCEPRDGVALAAACRVLHQGVVPDAFAARGVHQQAHRFKLVVARKDHRLDLDLASPVVALLVHLHVYEARQDVEQAVALQHLLPQVGGSIATPVRIGRIAGAAVAPTVERKETSGAAGEPRRHEHRLGVDREVDERAPLEGEDRHAWVTVLAILSAGVFHRLPSERVSSAPR